MRTYILVFLFMLFILALVWLEEIQYQETMKEIPSIILTSCDAGDLNTIELCSDSANQDDLIYIAHPVQDDTIEIKVNR